MKINRSVFFNFFLRWKFRKILRHYEEKNIHSHGHHASEHRRQRQISREKKVWRKNRKIVTEWQHASYLKIYIICGCCESWFPFPYSIFTICWKIILTKNQFSVLRVPLLLVVEHIVVCLDTRLLSPLLFFPPSSLHTVPWRGVRSIHSIFSVFWLLQFVCIHYNSE